MAVFYCGYTSLCSLYCNFFELYSASHKSYKVTHATELQLNLNLVVSICIVFHLDMCIVTVFPASHRSHVVALPTSSASGLEGFKAFGVFKEIEKLLEEVKQHQVPKKIATINTSIFSFYLYQKSASKKMYPCLQFSLFLFQFYSPRIISYLLTVTIGSWKALIKHCSCTIYGWLVGGWWLKK